MLLKSKLGNLEFFNPDNPVFIFVKTLFIPFIEEIFLFIFSIESKKDANVGNLNDFISLLNLENDFENFSNPSLKVLDLLSISKNDATCSLTHDIPSAINLKNPFIISF